MAMRPGADAAAITARVAAIGDVISTIFRDSKEHGITTLEAATRLDAA